LSAPVLSIKNIWNIEAATIRLTGNDFITPAIVDLSRTSLLVWKKKKAIIHTTAQPTIPLISAGLFQITNINMMTAMGNRVNKSQLIDVKNFSSFEIHIDTLARRHAVSPTKNWLASGSKF